MDAAKVGILAASVISGVAGWAILRGASGPRKPTNPSTRSP
jgi:Na+/H+ antiporter NhaA